MIDIRMKGMIYFGISRSILGDPTPKAELMRFMSSFHFMSANPLIPRDTPTNAGWSTYPWQRIGTNAAILALSMATDRY